MTGGGKIDVHSQFCYSLRDLFNSHGVNQISNRKRRTVEPRKQPEPISTIPVHQCEADVSEGLEGLAWREMKIMFDDRLERVNVPARAGVLRFEYVGNPYQLLKLRT